MSNPEWSPTFFIVPYNILSLPGITLSFLKVYEAIFQFWNKGKTCFLSDKMLMERANIGQSQLYESFAYFEKHNELVRKKINGRRYLVKPEMTIEMIRQEKDITSAAAEPHLRQGGSTTSAGAEHNIKNINKEININKYIPDFEKSGDLEKNDFEGEKEKSDLHSNHKAGQVDGWESLDNKGESLKSDYCENQIKNKPIREKIPQSPLKNNKSQGIDNSLPKKNLPTKKPKDYQEDERFMRFYSAYPKKEDPRDAWKAFKAIVGNDDPLLEKILQDIELRKEKHSKWQDKQFIKYPAVYLRKGEWLGEIFNSEDEIKTKREKDAAKAEERQALQEKQSRERAEQDRINQLHKQTDAKTYRSTVKQLPSDAQTSALRGIKNHLGIR